MNKSISNVKIDSITFYIISQRQFKPLMILFDDYIKKKYSHKNYLLIHLLLRAYSIHNVYENTPLYTFIQHYVKTYPERLVQTYMWG